MSFRVEPDSLTNFADLLESNADSGDELIRYLDQYLEIGEDGWGGPVDDVGLLNAATLDHTEIRARAEERLELVVDGHRQSANGVTTMVRYYREDDNAAAAEIDAAFSGADTLPVYEPPKSEQAALSFAPVASPEDMLMCPSSQRFGKQPEEINDWINQFNNYANVSYYLRTIIKEIVGYDPIEEVVTWYSGDWTALATWADGWANIGTGVNGIATNLQHTDAALAQVWEGNAADAAIRYFQDFHLAVLAEVTYYLDYLVPKYKNVMDIAYHGYQVIDSIVGELVDGLIDTGVTALLYGSLVLAPVGFVYEYSKKIMGTVKLIRETCKLLEAMHGGTRRGRGRDAGSRNPDRPKPPTDGSEPPCELETFLFPDGGADAPGAIPTGYEHPSEKQDEQ